MYAVSYKILETEMAAMFELTMKETVARASTPRPRHGAPEYPRSPEVAWSFTTANYAIAVV